MSWPHLVAYALGGAVLANAAPHWISGVMGRPFQSPFAKPPGRGLSSSTVNVLWGFANLAVAYLLLAKVGHFEVTSTGDAAATGIGILLMSMLLARTFGKLHGGNLPRDPAPDPARGA